MVLHRNNLKHASLYGAFLGSVLIHAFIFLCPTINHSQKTNTFNTHTLHANLRITEVDNVPFGPSQNSPKTTHVRSGNQVQTQDVISPNTNLLKDRPAKIVRLPDIKVPDELSTITGMVILEFSINKENKADDFSIIYSSPSGVFDGYVQHAIKSAELQYAIIDGVPTKVPVQIEVQFNGATLSIRSK